MTTIVNPTPSNNSSDGNGTGFLIGAILLILFGVMFFVYGLPMIQKAMNDGIQVKVQAPDSVKLDVEQPVQSTN